MRDYIKRVINMLPKLPQEQIKHIFKILEEKNKMLYSILESLSTGLIIVDRNWKIIQTNKASERLLFSLNKDEIKIENQPVWESIQEQEISFFLKKASESGKSNISEEFSVMRHNGSVRFLCISISSLITQSEISGSIIKIDDITQKRNQEVLLRRMENMAGLTNLAAGMAHEIKNPLGAISIHIQLIQKAIKKQRISENGLLPEKKFLEDNLDIINEEIETLNNLVMDFLFAVRPVKTELELKDPAVILKNIADFFYPEFNKAHISVNLKIPEKSKRIMIDPKLFKQAVINIIQNSLSAVKEKYSEDEYTLKKSLHDTGKIDISCVIQDDKYVIHIADNGCGMSRETSSRIFEPYFTTKANGTGLGMTMVYKIIKEFSADIQVKSKQGEGTLFSIILPIPQIDKKLLPENK